MKYETSAYTVNSKTGKKEHQKGISENMSAKEYKHHSENARKAGFNITKSTPRSKALKEKGEWGSKEHNIYHGSDAQ